MLKSVLNWKNIDFYENDNILQALLIHRKDALAIEHMFSHKQYMDGNLFAYCLNEMNTEFLEQAIKKEGFGNKMIKSNEECIKKLFTTL